MADYTDNNGSTYYNRNVCRSFNIGLTTSLLALSAQVCSEVTVINRTGQSVLFFDSGYDNAENGFLLLSGESYVFRGLTNSQQLSAQTQSGSGTLYYRTQYFSNSVQ